MRVRFASRSRTKLYQQSALQLSKVSTTYLKALSSRRPDLTAPLERRCHCDIDTALSSFPPSTNAQVNFFTCAWHSPLTKIAASYFYCLLLLFFDYIATPHHLEPEQPATRVRNSHQHTVSRCTDEEQQPLCLHRGLRQRRRWCQQSTAPTPQRTHSILFPSRYIIRSQILSGCCFQQTQIRESLTR